MTTADDATDDRADHLPGDGPDDAEGADAPRAGTGEPTAIASSTGKPKPS